MVNLHFNYWKKKKIAAVVRIKTVYPILFHIFCLSYKLTFRYFSPNSHNWLQFPSGRFFRWFYWQFAKQAKPRQSVNTHYTWRLITLLATAHMFSKTCLRMVLSKFSDLELVNYVKCNRKTIWEFKKKGRGGYKNGFRKHKTDTL